MLGTAIKVHVDPRAYVLYGQVVPPAMGEKIMLVLNAYNQHIH